MKPTITNTHFQLPPLSNWEGLKNLEIKSSPSFHEFNLPQTIIEREVEPPLYIWDRIVSVLDEQDKKKLSHIHSQVAPHAIKTEHKRRAILYAALIVFLAVIVYSLV